MDQVQEKGICISPFGVIPKRNKPNKWCLISDLLSPEGGSVNDAIAKELCSLSYISTDMVMKIILELGKGAVLAKLDIHQAYRNVPVHPADRNLLGIQWGGKVYMDLWAPLSSLALHCTS